MKDEYGLEAKFYDKIWGIYDYDADAEFLGKLFKENDCRSVIDVGCGTGNHALRLSRMGYEVTGVDLSSTMLRIARSKDRGGKIRFAQGDMVALDSITQKGERFDAAISLDRFLPICTPIVKYKLFSTVCSKYLGKMACSYSAPETQRKSMMNI